MADAAVAAGRNVDFGEAFRLGWKNYFNFNGRSSRGAFWWWQLAMIVLTFVASVLDSVLFGAIHFGHGMGPVHSLFHLITVIPSVAVGARRLHDVGRSGWWLLLVFTVIGVLLLLFWWVQPGQRKDNSFGPDAEAGR